MRSISIKKNFAYNVVLTMSMYVFGLIVFPYVSRVLGVDMMGRVNFADQTVNYFRILATMGVATVGVREIAACGDDRVKRSQVFSDIFSFVLLLTLGALVILLILMFIVPKFIAIRNLLFVGAFYLFFSSILIEWFYQGVEDFKYVTIRSLIVKTVYVALVFLLVKSPEDYLVYYALIAGTIVLNALINLGYSRKYATLSLRNSHPGRYAPSIIALGAYIVMLSFFSTFNVVYLGFVKGEHEVGVYTTATKIYTLILGVLTAYTTVMMPRVSALLAEKKEDEFRRKITVSFKLVIAAALPIIIICFTFAPLIIRILAGSQYSEAVAPMRIIMPLILVVGLAQVWVMQILLPMKKDKVVLLCAIASAVVGVLLNVFLVGKYSYVGSAFAMLGSEITNDTLTLAYALKHKLIPLPASR